MYPPSPLVISPKVVRAALDSLLYSTNNRLKNPLESLLQVSEILADPDLPDSPQSRRYALQELLISIITHELSHCRSILCLPPPNPFETLMEAHIAITRDAHTSNPELLSWSWLYYHYVRFDLHISPGEYADSANLDERTLRRYQSHVISRLTATLIRREKQIKAERRQQQMYAHLPTTAPILLFGRECEFQKVWHIIHSELPQHIQITGSAGVGKTAFVQEVVRQVINAREIDYLVWINEPDSADTIRQQLLSSLSAERTEYSVRDYAAKYRFALVLDEVEILRQDHMVELEKLLDDLSTELVFITNRLYMPLKNVRAHIFLSELDQPDALAMSRWIIKDHYRSRDSDLSNDLLRDVWESAGGNPLLIRAAMHLYELESQMVKL